MKGGRCRNTITVSQKLNMERGTAVTAQRHSCLRIVEGLSGGGKEEEEEEEEEGHCVVYHRLGQREEPVVPHTLSSCLATMIELILANWEENEDV